MGTNDGDLLPVRTAQKEEIKDTAISIGFSAWSVRVRVYL
ncbi:hypothetical protein LEP1GSC199_3857 [Leptospira vanthielii serovar Holland str. Waz Holland = ATCC 700522]|uniref:Uncharacterized protein n=1 Tax=Leptospira vanthielii serovar Holland str. Waz Holland = ATCC 700522 TaxID=1218591 RepID=N1W3D2_9LEPT|nr:hypothetical protein LEP1GSC199_3857 [Leptospira vanthielii serovar Holland str. Waz Holland = ATCC 700522]